MISLNVNPNSLSEVSPKVKQYNEIISIFITDTSNKYGMALSYTSLATEDVPLWTQTFNITAKMLMQEQAFRMIRTTML